MPGSFRSTPVPAGPGHPFVQEFRAVKRGRAGDDAAVALEGLWSVQHALDAGLRVDAAFVCPALVRGAASDDALAVIGGSGAPVFEVSERVFRRLVDRDGPDGLAALARLRAASLDHLVVPPGARLLVADAFELAGNLGTIIRCADGAGAAAVLLTEQRLRLTHPLVVKASMGTLFTMPVVAVDRPEALAWLRAQGCSVVAADPDAATSYRAADYSGSVAIVVGSERAGLAPFWRDEADAVVSIPMLGVADSLNVGHAAALLLYEALAWSASMRPTRSSSPGS